MLLCLVSACGIVIVAHGRSLFPDHLAGRGVTTVSLAQVAGTSALPVLTGAVMSAVQAAGGAPAAAFRAVLASIALCPGCGLAAYLRAPDARPSRLRAPGRPGQA